MPGVPGLFCAEQVPGWKAVVDAVHAKGGYIYAQIWRAERSSIPPLTGLPTVSASASPCEGDEVCKFPPPGTTEPRKDKDFPPIELSVEHIKRTIADYVHTAKLAIEECGFDGVEVHGGNGYVPEQFLSSNINKRTYEYGGSPEKRCKFIIELMEALKEAVGEDRLVIRLIIFGLYNEARGTQRVETWGHLCRERKARMNLSYVHFIESRYEQVHSVEEKQKCEPLFPPYKRLPADIRGPVLNSWRLPNIDLSVFRSIFGSTPFFSAGGWNDTNCWGVVESGACDGLAIWRYFLSTLDLVRR
jgi:2,4-dienoyl-CoA reductase-like NADH-dependent reductase (Old Yellow Enzyme family)